MGDVAVVVYFIPGWSYKCFGTMSENDKVGEDIKETVNG